MLSKLSREIHEARLNLNEHQVELDQEQLNKLLTARTKVLDASDNLHSVAIQLLGEIRRLD